MTIPTLALCIPAYNAAKYLPRLLKSAQKQSIKFDEIFVYDDCSTDTTIQVAEEHGATVVKGDVNRGQVYGKNKLTEITNCEWIHYHDADDELMPNFTKLAHQWMSCKQPFDVVLFDYEYRDNDTNKLFAIRHFEKESLEKDPISYSIREQINPFCGLYKKEFLLKCGGYVADPLELYQEDVAFHCHLAISGAKFSSESEVSIINYKINQSFSISSPLKCNQAQYHVMKRNAIRLGEKYKKEIACQLWGVAGRAAMYLDWETADNSILLAVKLNGRIPQDTSCVFKVLSFINPFWAIRMRERMIRILKPNLRLNK